MKYLKDKEQSADAVQQVFLKILSMNKLPPIQNCKAWLFIVMRNHCLQLLRHKNHTLSADALAVEVDRIEDEEEEDWWKSEATLQHLQGALQQLPTDQMRCISLFYLQQISYQQIMDQHGYTFTQVKSFIQNGKRNLKNILSQKINETGGNK
jgi:RNA polymerase sigma-70 factor (ECF subfamily)